MTILARAIVYTKKLRIVTKPQYVSGTVGMERNTRPFINRMIHSRELSKNGIGLTLYQIYSQIVKCIFIIHLQKIVNIFRIARGFRNENGGCVLLTQCISPFQYAGIRRLGVAPTCTSKISPKRTFIHDFGKFRAISFSSPDTVVKYAVEFYNKSGYTKGRKGECDYAEYQTNL